jgi:hypothetical protein
LKWSRFLNNEHSQNCRLALVSHLSKTELQIAQTLVRSLVSVTPTQHLLVPALSPHVPVALVRLCLVMAATDTTAATAATPE